MTITQVFLLIIECQKPLFLQNLAKNSALKRHSLSLGQPLIIWGRGANKKNVWRYGEIQTEGVQKNSNRGAEKKKRLESPKKMFGGMQKKNYDQQFNCMSEVCPSPTNLSCDTS